MNEQFSAVVNLSFIGWMPLLTYIFQVVCLGIILWKFVFWLRGCLCARESRLREMVLFIGFVATLQGIVACLSDVIFNIRPFISVLTTRDDIDLIILSMISALFPVLSGIIVLLVSVIIAAVIIAESGNSPKTDQGV